MGEKQTFMFLAALVIWTCWQPISKFESENNTPAEPNKVTNKVTSDLSHYSQEPNHVHSEFHENSEQNEGQKPALTSPTDSRFALGFAGMLRSYTLPELRANVESALVAPNVEDGGIDVFWHVYADPTDAQQNATLEIIRKHPQTVGLVIEPWIIQGGESSFWDKETNLQRSFPAYVLEDFKKTQPILAQGQHYIMEARSGPRGRCCQIVSDAVVEGKILSQWRKKSLVYDLIKRHVLQQRHGLDYSVVAIARSDVMFPVVSGKTVAIRFRHFEGNFLTLPDKGDFHDGLPDLFAAGDPLSVAVYAGLYRALPRLKLPQASVLDMHKGRIKINDFKSEAINRANLDQAGIKVARTPLVMTAIRTEQFMRNTILNSLYDPRIAASKIGEEGYPRLCKDRGFWSQIAGPRAECPTCCSLDEIQLGIEKALNEKAHHPQSVLCWGGEFFAKSSYIGVLDNANMTECRCVHHLHCDICAPIAHVTQYRCNKFRGMYCMRSHFNHRPHAKCLSAKLLGSRRENETY